MLGSAGWPKRYTLVGLCFCATLICYIDRSAMSVAIVPMAAQFNWDRETQGIILSSFFVGYLATQILGGRMADRFGGKLLLGGAVLAWSLFTLLTVPAALLGLVPFVLARIGMGLGEGLAFPSIFSLFGRNLPAIERTRAIGFNASGISLGTVFALLVSPLIIELWGWQWVFYLFGLLGVLWCVIWWRFDLRDTNPAQDLEPDDYNSQEGTHQENQDSPPWKLFLSSPAIWAIIVSSFCVGWATYTLLAWLPSYLAEKSDVGFQSVGALAMLPFLASFISLNMVGWVTDGMIKRGVSLKRVRIIMQTLGAGGLGLALLLVGLVDTAGAAVAFMTIGMGLSSFTMGGHGVNLFDLAPKHAGLLQGMAGTASTIPGVIGVYIGGLILQFFDNWALLFQIAAVLNLLGLLFYLACFSVKPLIAAASETATTESGDEI